METRNAPDLTRTTFQLLALAALIASSFWILRPFLVALSWAAMIVVATWPLLLHAQAWLAGKRSLAAALMTIVLLLILVVPLYFAITTMVGSADQIVSWSKSLAALPMPQPPGWVETVPLIGPKIVARWQELAAAGPAEASARLAPFARTLALWFAGQVGSFGLLLLQFLLTVIIAAILYVNGEKAARAAQRFAERIAGSAGEKAVYLMAQSVRAVALGVVLTAILQSAFAGIGLVIVGVPFTAILTAIIFVLTVAQLGAAPVLVPAVIWVYMHSGAVWGTGFLIWSIFCGTFDNFLRPVLIKRGADLPLLLIFAGVIGGLIAFGVIGLFIGPVVLAVGYTLLVDWVRQGSAAEDEEQPPRPLQAAG